MACVCARVAAARRQGREGKIVLFEGDGGLLFHIQGARDAQASRISHPNSRHERRRIRLGVHKLRADGIDDSLAVFGRPALENIARGFGLRPRYAMCR
jgi:hypothetical protein